MHSVQEEQDFSSNPSARPFTPFACSLNPLVIYACHRSNPCSKAGHESHEGTQVQCSGCCRSDPLDEANGNKRKRFTDEQLTALTDLAEEANWSLLSVAKEAREQFCTKYEISKVRIHAKTDKQVCNSDSAVTLLSARSETPRTAALNIKPL